MDPEFPKEPSSGGLPPAPGSDMPPAPPPGTAGSPAPGFGFGAFPQTITPAESGVDQMGSPTRRRRVLAVLVAGALVLGGGAAAAAFLSLRGSSEHLLKLVPATSDLVVTASLDPSASQKVNLLRLAHRFPALASDSELKGQLNDAIDATLADSGLTHDDLTTWLGSEVSIIVDFDASSGSSRTGLLLDSKDDAAAQSALGRISSGGSAGWQTRDYNGVTMHIGSDRAWAIVDGAVVLAENSTFVTQVIDVADGRTTSLAEDPWYLRTESALPDDRLGLLYLNPTDLIHKLVAQPGFAALSGTPGLSTLNAVRAVGVSISAEPDGLSFDSTISYQESMLDPATRASLDASVHTNALVGYVPADSFAVVTGEGLDTSLRQVASLAGSGSDGRLRSQLGIDSAIASLTGDIAMEASPGSGTPIPGAALLVGVKDPGPLGATVGIVAHSLPVGKAWRTTAYHGVTINYLRVPELDREGIDPAYAAFGGAVVLATSPAEIRKLVDVHEGAPSISSSTRYRSAMARVPTGASSAYLDVAGLASTIRGVLPAQAREVFDREVAPNLAPIESVTAGATSSSMQSRARVFVAFKK